MGNAQANQELWAASSQDNLSGVKTAVSAGAEVNSHDAKDDESSSLHKAARRGYAGVASYLLERKAFPRCINKNRDMPVHGAAQSGQFECLRVLLAAGADVDDVGANGRTVLMHASLSGNPQCVQHLIRMGANTDVRDFEGRLAADLAGSDAVRDIFKRITRRDPVLSSAAALALEDADRSQQRANHIVGLEAKVRSGAFPALIPRQIMDLEYMSYRKLHELVMEGFNVPSDIEQLPITAIVRENVFLLRIGWNRGSPIGTVPIERRAAIAEFVIRANAGLPLGYWDFSAETGELQFAASLLLQCGEDACVLVGQLKYVIEPLVNDTIVSYRRYHPGVRMCILEEKTAEQACAHCEQREPGAELSDIIPPAPPPQPELPEAEQKQDQPESGAAAAPLASSSSSSFSSSTSSSSSSLPSALVSVVVPVSQNPYQEGSSAANPYQEREPGASQAVPAAQVVAAPDAAAAAAVVVAGAAGVQAGSSPAAAGAARVSVSAVSPYQSDSAMNNVYQAQPRALNVPVAAVPAPPEQNALSVNVSASSPYQEEPGAGDAALPPPNDVLPANPNPYQAPLGANADARPPPNDVNVVPANSNPYQQPLNDAAGLPPPNDVLPANDVAPALAAVASSPYQQSAEGLPPPNDVLPANDVAPAAPASASSPYQQSAEGLPPPNDVVPANASQQSSEAIPPANDVAPVNVNSPYQQSPDALPPPNDVLSLNDMGAASASPYQQSGPEAVPPANDVLPANDVAALPAASMSPQALVPPANDHASPVQQSPPLIQGVNGGGVSAGALPENDANAALPENSVQ